MPQGGEARGGGGGATHQQRGRATHIERLKSAAAAEAEQETCPSGGNATWPDQARPGMERSVESMSSGASATQRER